MPTKVACVDACLVHEVDQLMRRDRLVLEEIELRHAAKDP